MTGDLTGRRALVLGGSSGLGFASATALADAGATVLLTSRNARRAADAADSLPGTGHRGAALDLAVPEQVDTFTAGLDGGFNVLVLNAGGPAPARASEVDAERVTAALVPLLLSQISIVRAVLPDMIESGWGRIVGIGSSGVQQPIPTLALSNVGRAAVAAYLKSLAADVAAAGVTVNMVLPGRIATARVASLDSARAETTGTSVDSVRVASEGTIPAGRYGEPAEFAAAVRFLCSPVASYITGVQLRADGGMVGSY